MYFLRSDDARERWDVTPLLLPGWLVTAATRDASGRSYLGVTHDVWGAAVMVSDDLERWEQADSAPRYEEGERGNEEHLRTVGAMDPMGASIIYRNWSMIILGNFSGDCLISSNSLILCTGFLARMKR